MSDVASSSRPVAIFSNEKAVLTPPAPTGFCRLARFYAPLEMLMFGRELERARFCFLEHLRDCRDILLLGEGDGRCLEQLIKIAPQARLHCVDSSPAMLRRAAARLPARDRGRVAFVCANVLEWNPPKQGYDAVVTLFFLDCFWQNEVRRLVERMQPALRPGARWLWADFVLPASGPARWRAQLWLRAKYGFFHWAPDLSTRALPPSGEILRAAGWRPVAAQKFHRIFVFSVLSSQPGCDT